MWSIGFRDRKPEAEGELSQTIIIFCLLCFEAAQIPCQNDMHQNDHARLLLTIRSMSYTYTTINTHRAAPSRVSITHRMGY